MRRWPFLPLLLTLLCAATLNASTFYYQKPDSATLPDTARFIFYDPSTLTDKNITGLVLKTLLAPDLSGVVPKTYTVNGHALSGNVSVTVTDLSLENVDNTADADKPVSTLTQTELDLKAPLASPAFSGTPTGITKAAVGLANADNTADSSKPVSTAMQSALDLKANTSSPVFTGTMTAPSFISNAADTYHYIECSNTAAMSIVGLDADNEGRFCYDKTLHKYRYWTGAALADMQGASSLALLSDWPAGVSATEVGYLDNATSELQSQITAKESTANKGVVNGYVGISAIGVASTPKQNNTADKWTLASDDGTSTNGAGWEGPTGAVANSFWFRLPATEPTNGQVMILGTPVDHHIPITYGTAATNPMTTAGDMIGGGADGATTRIAGVAAGQALLSGGTSAIPAWAGYTFAGTASATYTFPGATKTLAANDGSNLTIASQAAGDILVAASGTAYARLGIGADNAVLTISPTTHVPVWSAPGGGSMVYPGAGIAYTADGATWGTSYGAGNLLPSSVGGTGNGFTKFSGPTTSEKTFTLPDASKTLAANDGSNLTISGQAIGDLAVASSTTAYGKLADVAAGSVLVSGGVGAAPSYATALPSGVTATTQAAADNSTKVATTAYVDRATPLAAGTGASLAGPKQYYVCTGTCSVTPPTPAAGYEFCIYNDTAVTTAITLVAIASCYYEKADRSAYGTVNTELSISAAAGNKICIVGRDATHYQTISYTGNVTAN